MECHLKQEANLPFLCLFVLHEPSVDCMVPTQASEGGSLLLTSELDQLKF
jgi:hypothetical protein